MKNRKVIRSAGVVGGFTLLSRGLGMLRDVLIAFWFGTSVQASAFFVAFTIPNLFRRLFGEGALSAAFIPVLIETRKRDGEAAAWKMTSKVATIVFSLLFVIAVSGVFCFSMALHLPGLGEKWAATFALSRIMFPYVLFICLAALAMAILNSYRHFATSAFAPSLLNLILIGTMLGLFPLLAERPETRSTTLAWAVLAAGVAQLAIQIPALRRFGCPCRPAGQWNDPRIRQMLLLMGPATLGMAVTQLNVLFDRLLAMWIGPWAPAALFYSERMIYFPLGVIATAMGTVLLPTFSVHASEDDADAMRDVISHSLRHLLFIMMPAALGLFVLAPDILSVLFEWGGRFDAGSSLLAARALRAYAFGLVVFSAAKVFVPAFYAMKDTRTPVRIGIWTVALNLTLNLLFILTLPPYWKHAGMALATVLAEAAGAGVLVVVLAKRVKGLPVGELIASLLRSMALALPAIAAAWAVNRFAGAALLDHVPDKAAHVLALLSALATGIAVYPALALLFRVPELGEIAGALRPSGRATP